MRLTQFTDYSLRALLYLAMNREGLVTIQDIADAHRIAKNHLTKVINHLSAVGLVESIRGRNGGLRLGREPGDICIGDVVRQTESDFYIAECFNQATQDCLYSSGCSLKGALGKATGAFLGVLDGFTLETILERERASARPDNAVRPVKLQLKSSACKKAVSTSDA
jgi:Rrf2 family nitric oxide-sensitive transcriptional repressor